MIHVLVVVFALFVGSCEPAPDHNGEICNFAGNCVTIPAASVPNAPVQELPDPWFVRYARDMCSICVDCCVTTREPSSKRADSAPSDDSDDSDEDPDDVSGCGEEGFVDDHEAWLRYATPEEVEAARQYWDDD